MPPVVQSLEEILAELETAYAPVRGIYNQSAAAIPQKYELRRTALEGSKNKNFDAIAGQAGRAGMSWGGFTQNEQADYLADKYLPGMQQTFLDQDEEGRGIAKSLAELELEKRMSGMNKRSDQQKVLQSFQEAERQRAFQAEQARLEREESSRQASLNRGASAKPDTYSRDRQDAIGANLAAATGRDGRVSPSDWARARADWIAQRFDPKEFETRFRHLVNDTYPTYASDYGLKGGSPGQPGRKAVNNFLSILPRFR